jgi:AraC-like DNA-binding protein
MDPLVDDGVVTPYRSYREWPAPAGLSASVACVWRSHDRPVQVLPDGCVDVVLNGGRLVVAGPATGVQVVPAVRVLRFQRFLHLAHLAGSGAAVTLADLAAGAGYADQAHLARECRRLAGLPPSGLLATRPIAAGEMAGSFKPAGAR